MLMMMIMNFFCSMLNQGNAKRHTHTDTHKLYKIIKLRFSLITIFPGASLIHSSLIPPFWEMNYYSIIVAISS